jgi:hypothetical protein
MNDDAPMRSALAHTDLRKLGLRLAVAAGTLAAITMALTGVHDGSGATALSRPALAALAPRTPQPVSPRAVDDQAARELVSRFALNALLATLIDDDEPPRWTDVGLNYYCGPQTRVEVDGKPIVPGARMPANAFTLRWHMDQCSLFDSATVELSGIVELLVTHEGTQLKGVVSADRMVIWSATGLSRVTAPFTAWLQPPETRPPVERHRVAP